MKTEIDVKVTRIDYRCDTCSTGFMRSTGYVQTCNPPKYAHQCDNPECRVEQTFKEKYPYLEYSPAL